LKIVTISNCDLVESQGSGYVIVNFTRGLKALGHDVRLVRPDDCLALPGLNKARSLRLAWGFWRKAVRLIRDDEPDIVEFYGGEAWLAADRLRRWPKRRFRIVAHSNGIEPFCAEILASHGIHNTSDGRPPRWHQGRLRLPLARAFTQADAIVTVSQAEADYALRQGMQPVERVLAIDNALPAEFLGLERPADRPKVMGYCGSWLARKGVALLAGDIAAALRLAPAWRLHLVGVGREFRPEEHFPADLLSRIEVVGFVAEKAELRRLYQSWSIALMPSVYESFGLVGAEAMAGGCALVAAATGFAASLEHGREAMLLPTGRSPELREAVLRLVADEALRRRVADGGWQRVQQLRWDDSLRRLEAFYRGLTPASSS
jgi:glycosyltransferase involved in cell wall biosynthesis